MFLYLVKRADRRSKPLSRAHRRQAAAWTWLIAFAVVLAVVLAAAG